MGKFILAEIPVNCPYPYGMGNALNGMILKTILPLFFHHLRSSFALHQYLLLGTAILMDEECQSYNSFYSENVILN